MPDKDIFEISDEELAQMNPPEIKEDESDTEPEPKEETSTESEGQEENNDTESSEIEPKTEESDEEKDDDSSTGSEEKNEEDKEPEETKPSVPEIDYKQFYDAVTGSIKANGKEVQFKKPEEIIRLMQMGANYTQKMQNLAPYRKKIQTLQKAGLLDDEKLNYLIDLSQGNPEAVKKLLRDSKLDPMDLDIQSEPKYVPGNHTISDAEARLQTTLDDLTSTPEGLQTVQIAQRWDQASLRELGNDPSILTTLHEQRQNGVYNLITTEMERQRMLGNLPEGTPFLQAYKAVGEYLLKQAQQQQLAQQKVLEKLPQGTLNKPVDKTKEQVKSAAPTGRSKKPATQFVDPFTLSDEEFEKQFANYR